MRQLAPILSLAVALSVGCTNTGAGNDPLIPDELVLRAVRVASLSTLLGSELGLVVADPPQGGNSCPTVVRDGDQFLLDYGAGCVPDSGLTTELIAGTADLTVASGSGAFLGSITSFGVAPASLTASVSGSQSRAGDLFTVDLDLSDGLWVREGVESTWNAFLEITGDQDTVSLFVDSGSLLGATAPAMRIDVGDIAVPRADLAGCFVPADGTLALFKDRGQANLTFSADSHASGNITANFNDHDPATVGPCGG